MELKAHHIMVGAGLASAAHVAAALWVLALSPHSTSAAGDGAGGGIEMSLAPVGGAASTAALAEVEEVVDQIADAVATDPPPPVQDAALAEPVDDIDPVEPLDPETTADETLADTPEVAADAPTVVESDIAELVAAETIEPIAETVDDRPDTGPDVVAREPTPRERTVAPSAPTAAKPPVQRPEPADQADETPAPQPSQELADSAAASELTTLTGAAAASGPSAGPSGAGDPGARQTFLSKIAALLKRHRRYPRRARARGQEGAGTLSFIMNAAGDVIQAELRTSSGHRLLDREILDLLERAQPLPPIPPELGVDSLSLVVPITFRLQ